MNEFLSEVIKIVVSYVLVLGIGFGLINFMSNGFFITFIKVKISRGKKLLVEVVSLADIYFKTGIHDGNQITYKNRQGKEKLLVVDKGSVYYKIGVKALTTDEESNAVLNYTNKFSPMEGCDSVKMNNLLKRSIQSPTMNDNFQKIMMILVIITIVVSALSMYFGYNSFQTLMAFQKSAGVI